MQFTSADGTKSSIAAFCGAPVVVNLWATWCTPCVKEMPAFDEVAAEHTAVKIIGVNVGDTADAARSFAADLGISYPQFTD
ncbi:MAG: TlpA disulfide reductase family protein, partial [Actinomycetota bacterium]